MSRKNVDSSVTSDRLSFAQAARLAGVPKAYLRELAEAGRLAVYLVPGEQGPKQRVSVVNLTEAGLLSSVVRAPAPTKPDDGARELIALIREQRDRITTLEEQRFQLGAQMGVALERIASLEEQLQDLSTPFGTRRRITSIEAGGSESNLSRAAVRLRDVAWQLTDAGFQRSARFGVSLIRTRSIRATRSHSSSTAD